jgi:hypothetical protein
VLSVRPKAENVLLVFAPGAEGRPFEVVKVRNGLYKDMSITVSSQQGMLDALKPTSGRLGNSIPQLEHDGISYWLGPRNPDSHNFSDNAAESTLLYFAGGKWTRLMTMIAN